MKCIAIIPARGGSKRIKRKNVKEFAGVPVIASSIRAALAAGCFDEVMVSTDDPEIAGVARRYGAVTPFMRSDATSDDYATTADVIAEVLERYAADGRTFDALACIYATAPFVTPRRLADAFGIIERGEAEGAFTCVEYSYPVQRGLVIGDDGRISMRHPEYATARSQDLQKTYHDAGQFYFSTVAAFTRGHSLWGPDTRPVVLPELEVQDLDTPVDWRLAEMKYEMLSFPRRIQAGDYSLVALTEVSPEVSELVRLGRNADDVRSRMVNTQVISREAHEAFVESLRTRRDKQYYAVFSPEGDFIGSVNLEWIGHDSVERGIWLDAGARGRGHAGRMLGALYALLADRRDVRTILTRVRPDNEASLALERSLGGVETGERDGCVMFETVIKP